MTLHSRVIYWELHFSGGHPQSRHRHLHKRNLEIDDVHVRKIFGILHDERSLIALNAKPNAALVSTSAAAPGWYTAFSKQVPPTIRTGTSRAAIKQPARRPRALLAAAIHGE